VADNKRLQTALIFKQNISYHDYNFTSQIERLFRKFLNRIILKCKEKPEASSHQTEGTYLVTETLLLPFKCLTLDVHLFL